MQRVETSFKARLDEVARKERAYPDFQDGRVGAIVKAGSTVGPELKKWNRPRKVRWSSCGGCLGLPGDFQNGEQKTDV